MSLPFGLSVDRLKEIFEYLYECIELSFKEFDEYEFIKTFLIEGEFIFNFRRYYLLDEVILTAYLKNGIEMEYNDIIKDSNGNELSFDQCKNLVRWYLAEESDLLDWVPMKNVDSKLNINDSVYDLFKEHIRENICPELNVKAKFEKKEEKVKNPEGIMETTYIYYTFIGLQASRGLPFGFSYFKLKMQARHKYQDYIEKYDKETEKIEAFKNKIKKSTIICKKFLNKVAKLYRKNKRVSLNSYGKLVDKFVNCGLQLSTDEATKLSEQIRNIIEKL
jgi:hypothetical protein